MVPISVVEGKKRIECKVLRLTGILYTKISNYFLEIHVLRPIFNNLTFHDLFRLSWDAVTHESTKIVKTPEKSSLRQGSNVQKSTDSKKIILNTASDSELTVPHTNLLGTSPRNMNSLNDLFHSTEVNTGKEKSVGNVL